MRRATLLLVLGSAVFAGFPRALFAQGPDQDEGPACVYCM